jgi:hypothetical protein
MDGYRQFKEVLVENRDSETARFQTLKSMGQVISVLGWITVGGGGIVSFVAMAAVAGLEGRRGGSGLGVIIAAGPGLLVAIFGALIVAAGQTISCFVSIEKNTHAAWEAQKAVLKALGGHSLPAPDVSIQKEAEERTPSAPIEPVQSARPVTKQVACPKCKITEDVQKLYDVNQYNKFDAVNKSGFGFQSISLTCKNCGCVFRV